MQCVSRAASRSALWAAPRGAVALHARPGLALVARECAGEVEPPRALEPRRCSRARLSVVAAPPAQADGREFGQRAGVELLTCVSFEDGRRPAAKWVSQRLTLDAERVGAGAAHRLCRTGALWEGRAEPGGGYLWRRLRPNARLEAGSLVGVRRRASRMAVGLVSAGAGAGTARFEPRDDGSQPRSSVLHRIGASELSAAAATTTKSAAATKAAAAAAAKAASWVRILHATPDVVFVHKAAGTPAHSAPPTRGPGPGPMSVVEATARLLAARYGAQTVPPPPPAGESRAPRLVHRLDTDTAGVMVLARHRPAAVALSDAFKAGTAGKAYLAETGAPANPAIPAGLLAPAVPPSGCRAQPCTCGAAVVAAPLPRDPLLVCQSGSRAGLGAAQSVAAFSHAAARATPLSGSRDWVKAVSGATRTLGLPPSAARQLAADWAGTVARDANSTIAPAGWRDAAPPGCWMLRQSAGGSSGSEGSDPAASALARASALAAALSATRRASAAAPHCSSWLCQPRSGRKHQVRLHVLLRTGAPLVGDRRYGHAGDQASDQGASRGGDGKVALGLVSAALALPPLPGWAQAAGNEASSRLPLAATADLDLL
uniref:Pseudouridine synthase RsuA/RluA-like domain-containing protein n=1 Tax=Cafeteria roenbergensis TaxID=33653 RepID=A0A7S0PB96_CAFRO|mmetsp:Transcript_20313/g.78009  ORF Transcript_20313/g.78009 Transcript_20313/m.78009 type:complete len:601 (+) Transcript_20313:102-1904(+)